MLKKYFIFLFFISSGLSAQDAISGYLEMENKLDLGPQIYLSKVTVNDLQKSQKIEEVASFQIVENGFFAFKKKLFSKKETIYQLRINTRNKNSTVNKFFILSSKDSIRFTKSKKWLESYVTTNKADKEWQKLRNFETRLFGSTFNKEDSISNAYVNGLKTYVKDSLKILMVKLISIKQLENKSLLERDIIKNLGYYITLLKELKESDIDRTEYLFLENKLTFLTVEIAEKKYATSKSINILLSFGLLIFLCVYLYILNNKKKTITVDLSKQERNIKALILDGKTNKQIANELFISVSTVKTHITNIYSKLQISGREELLQKIKKS